MSIDAACNKVDIHRSAISKWKAKPHLLKVANGGTVSTIDVATLPKRTKRGGKKGQHILRTPLVKAQLVAKVKAAVTAGGTIAAACKKLRFSPTQFREWKNDKSLKAALNGYSLHPVNGSAVRLVLQLNGEDHTVSLQEAINLRTGLDAVLGARE
jgi:transposase-like protein